MRSSWGRPSRGPKLITRGFVAAAQGWQRANDPQRVFVGIDMGGTRTKFGLVSNQGELLYHSCHSHARGMREEMSCSST